MMQSAGQSSPSTLLPSSQVSPTSTMLLPHTSVRQMALQPSPPTRSPSSQVSPSPVTPLPHVSSGMRFPSAVWVCVWMAAESPVVTHGGLASSFAKQPLVGSAPPVYFVCAFAMHALNAAGSGLVVFLPSHPRTAFTRFATHLNLPAVHLLSVDGGAVGSSEKRTAPVIAWACPPIASESPVVRHGGFASRFAKQPFVGTMPPLYLVSALSMHCGNLIGSGFALSLLKHPSSPVARVVTHFSLPASHFALADCAWAVPPSARVIAPPIRAYPARRRRTFICMMPPLACRLRVVSRA